MNKLSAHNSDLRQPKHDEDTKTLKHDRDLKAEHKSQAYDLDQRKIRFEKAIKTDLLHADSKSNEDIDSEMITSKLKDLNQYGLKERERGESLRDSGSIRGVMLTDAVKNLITSRTKEERSITEIVIMGDNILNSMGSRITSSLNIDQSKSADLVGKVGLAQSLVAAILPKVSSISDKQEIIIRFQSKDNNQLEIKLSRQGNELSVIVKAANIDIYNQVSNARQDIQYSLESKLPSIIVRIDMDLTDQSDREGKGYYILPDEDEL
jgi:hypothetical protein